MFVLPLEASLAGGQNVQSSDYQSGSNWGPYEAAIRRWERVLGRSAPAPTELGSKGGSRLSAAFVEFLMGLPEGWVTAPALGLSRVQQLKMLGNGVVTQQAIKALRVMRGAERKDNR